jgi:hypothetical protein
MDQDAVVARILARTHQAKGFYEEVWPAENCEFAFFSEVLARFDTELVPC